MSDHALMWIDLVMLAVIVWQGFWVMWWERETFRMNKERYDERKQWRDAKRKQQERKAMQPVSDTQTAN